MTVKLINKIAELLYPGSIYCVACGNLIDDTRPYALCDRCRTEIEWHMGKLPGDHEFRYGVSCALYNGFVKNMVRDMKYRDKPYIANSIAEIMSDRVAGTDDMSDIETIIPVPMHPNKKRKRGYNQTELMAEHLSKSLSIRYAPGTIIKTRVTESMSSKNLDERHIMLTDAFAINPELGEAGNICGKHVLLIDDVFTTGSTSDACSRVLLDAGASSVDLFVFATGALKSDTEIR